MTDIEAGWTWLKEFLEDIRVDVEEAFNHENSFEDTIGYEEDEWN